MDGRLTTAEREIRLAPHGAGRWFSAAFLSFWLCGWAVGESLVLWLLIKGGIALLTGTPPDPGREPLEFGPSLAVGGFLLFWLALWTLGGVLAMRELLLLLWAVDRLAVRAGELEVVRWRGPFRSRREYPRDAIRRIALMPKHDRLVVETDRGTVELSTLGTRDQREQAMLTLRSELGLSDAGAPDEATLPEGWEAIITPEGERALVPKLALRRTQARLAGVATAALGLVTVMVGYAAVREWEFIALAALTLAATIAAGWGCVWLARGRNEWRIGSGRLVLRRRFGAQVRDLFEARRLELTVSSDSDGDEWFDLEAVGDPSASPEPATALRQVGRPTNRRSIARVMTDPTVPRRLGAWLARAADLPLEDRTTRQSKAIELAELRTQLEATGRLGKWAAKLLEHVGERKRAG